MRSDRDSDHLSTMPWPMHSWPSGLPDQTPTQIPADAPSAAEIQDNCRTKMQSLRDQPGCGQKAYIAVPQ